MHVFKMFITAVCLIFLIRHVKSGGRGAASEKDLVEKRGRSDDFC